MKNLLIVILISLYFLLIVNLSSRKFSQIVSPFITLLFLVIWGIIFTTIAASWINNREFSFVYFTILLLNVIYLLNDSSITEFLSLVSVFILLHHLIANTRNPKYLYLYFLWSFITIILTGISIIFE